MANTTKWALSIAASLFLLAPALAIPLAGGQTAFYGAPRLLRAAVTNATIEDYPVYYQFTVELPQTLDEPLGRLGIDIPTEYGDFGLIPPSPREVRAFIPTEPYARAPQYAREPLATRVEASRTQVNLTFDPPVAPGRVLTVEWGPIRNPRMDGVYDYGITAFPAGQAPRGQFVGFGRIVIRRGGRG